MLSRPEEGRYWFDLRFVFCQKKKINKRIYYLFLQNSSVLVFCQSRIDKWIYYFLTEISWRHLEEDTCDSGLNICLFSRLS